MAAKHDAVINELNFKIDKLIKLYISSLPLALTGALLSFAPSLVSLLSDKTEAKNSVISIFNKLLEN